MTLRCDACMIGKSTGPILSRVPAACVYVLSTFKCVFSSEVLIQSTVEWMLCGAVGLTACFRSLLFLDEVCCLKLLDYFQSDVII